MSSPQASRQTAGISGVHWKQAPQLLWWAIKDFTSDNGPQWAAAIAYYTLLSIFPLLLAALGIASYFVNAQWAANQASDLMRSFLPTGQDQIRNVVRGVFQARGGMGLLSLAALLWTGSRVFGVATQALNIAFDADESYGFLKRTLVQFVMAASIGLLFLLALTSRLVINLAWNFLPFLSQHLDILRQALEFAVPGLLLIVALYLTYLYVPRRDVQPPAAWAGAILATVVFMIARPLFLTYVRRFGNYNLVYGSLAIVVILVLWTWLVAIIFLYGGEVASLVKAVLIEGKSRHEIEEAHRLRSPARNVKQMIEKKPKEVDRDGANQGPR